MRSGVNQNITYRTVMGRSKQYGETRLRLVCVNVRAECTRFQLL